MYRNKKGTVGMEEGRTVYNRPPLSTVESKMPRIVYVPGNTPVYYPGSLYTSPLDADHPLVRFLRNQRPGAGPWDANIGQDLGHGLFHTCGSRRSICAGPSTRR